MPAEQKSHTAQLPEFYFILHYFYPFLSTVIPRHNACRYRERQPDSSDIPDSRKQKQTDWRNCQAFYISHEHRFFRLHDCIETGYIQLCRSR